METFEFISYTYFHVLNVLAYEFCGVVLGSQEQCKHYGFSENWMYFMEMSRGGGQLQIELSDQIFEFKSYFLNKTIAILF